LYPDVEINSLVPNIESAGVDFISAPNHLATSLILFVQTLKLLNQKMNAIIETKRKKILFVLLTIQRDSFGLSLNLM